MLEHFNPHQIQDLEGARQAIVHLLNLVEELKQENLSQRAEIQALRDEINRLKGEDGKPEIKANKKQQQDHSSENERKGSSRKRRKRKRHAKLKIDREEIVRIDKNQLPSDAKFKGYEDVIVQDLRIETDTIRFRKEKYYSASARKTYLAALPKGYKGQFGPTIRALVPSLYYAGGMSEPKIIELLEQMGVNISKGKVSTLLSKETALWEAEADAILQAGLSSSTWQHIDDTGTRVNGVNGYCHILCNPFYTSYATRPKKNRLSVIAVLQNTERAVCLFNQETEKWLTQFNTPDWVQKEIAKRFSGSIIALDEVEDWLSDVKELNLQQKARICEAGALTAYYAQDKYPVIPILVSDNAPQFHHLTEKQSLCWVHEGRHYKKLLPQVVYHREILDKILEEFWAYYHKLQAYKADPAPGKATALRFEFERLFSQKTDYEQLNQRLSKTLKHQEKLLLVLDHPEVPLHNNSAELGVRQRVRKRDISFGPRTEDGKVAWDSLMTISETAKKMKVSFYQYMLDRVSQKNAMPSLADMIRLRVPAPVF